MLVRCRKLPQICASEPVTIAHAWSVLSDFRASGESKQPIRARHTGFARVSFNSYLRCLNNAQPVYVRAYGLWQIQARFTPSR